MSTYVLLARLIIEMAELHLDTARAEGGVAVLGSYSVLVQDHASLPRVRNTPRDALAAIRA
jgi:hypothetical protein